MMVNMLTRILHDVPSIKHIVRHFCNFKACRGEAKAGKKSHEKIMKVIKYGYKRCVFILLNSYKINFCHFCLIT